jgi:DNA phosphorothioation system restriction enzyme
MVADRILDFKLALPRNKLRQGEFHDKFGIFTDAIGGRVAFSGSYNDSMQGLLNYESIKIFTSWTEGFGPIVEAEQRRFDELWENRDPNVEVFDILPACHAEILKLRKAERPYKLPPWVERIGWGEKRGSYRVAFAPPAGFEPREYQKTAMRKWLDNNGKGILAMATGTGKTPTALYLACKVTEKIKPCLLIVTCPYLNLARQWAAGMRNFGLEPICCHDAWTTWSGQLQNALTGLSVGSVPLVAVVVTNATFLTPRFQGMIGLSKIPRLLIADEVHNLGADALRESLDKTIQYRLGLSATPERHYDSVGTVTIMDYFGGVVFEYGLADAIRDDVLCRYIYHPVLVDLSDEEGEEYWDLTLKISQFFGSKDEEAAGEMPVALKMLLMRRSRLLASASSKLPTLAKIVRELPSPLTRGIVYCGDGRVEAEESGDADLIRQVEAAVQLLGKELRLRVRKFTCDEPMEEREEILGLLREGVIDAAVAIRCLDEGIDVPDVRMGFLLASSTNPRQFIQRRGRLLRKAPGKSRAEIWDFIVRPPDLGGHGDDAAFNVERRLFRRELLRIVEFCKTAENGDTALHALEELRRRYNLMDLSAVEG